MTLATWESLFPFGGDECTCSGTRQRHAHPRSKGQPMKAPSDSEEGEGSRLVERGGRISPHGPGNDTAAYEIHEPHVKVTRWSRDWAFWFICLK